MHIKFSHGNWKNQKRFVYKEVLDSYVCAECHEKFPSSAYLKYHLTYSHLTCKDPNGFLSKNHIEKFFAEIDAQSEKDLKQDRDKPFFQADWEKRLSSAIEKNNRLNSTCLFDQDGVKIKESFWE